MRALPTLLVVVFALALGAATARADVAPAHAGGAAAHAVAHLVSR